MNVRLSLKSMGLSDYLCETLSRAPRRPTVAKAPRSAAAASSPQRKRRSPRKPTKKSPIAANPLGDLPDYDHDLGKRRRRKQRSASKEPAGAPEATEERAATPSQEPAKVEAPRAPTPPRKASLGKSSGRGRPPDLLAMAASQRRMKRSPSPEKKNQKQPSPPKTYRPPAAIRELNSRRRRRRSIPEIRRALDDALRAAGGVRRCGRFFVDPGGPRGGVEISRRRLAPDARGVGTSPFFPRRNLPPSGSRGGARAEPERAVAGTCRRWTAEAEKTHNPPAALRLSRAEQAYRRSCLEEGSYASFDGRPSTASARNAMLQAAWKQFSASRSSYFRRAPRREKSPRERSTTFLTQGGGLALAPG